MAYRVPPSGPKNPALVVRREAPGAPRKKMPAKSRLSNTEKANMKKYENYGDVWSVNINGKIPVGNADNKNIKNLSWANRPPTKKNKGGRRKTVRRNKHN